MVTYLQWTTAELYFRNIFEVTRICYISNGRRLTKKVLHILLLSTFRVSSINFYLVCSLPIHKICALCGMFSEISVLLTTENFGDLEIRVPDGSNVIECCISEFLMCHFLLVINFTRSCILYRLWDIAFDMSTIALFCYPSCVLTPRRRGSPETISVKFCAEVTGWLSYTVAKKYCRNFQPPV